MDCSIFDRVYAGMLKSASEFQTGNQDGYQICTRHGSFFE